MVRIGILILFIVLLVFGCQSRLEKELEAERQESEKRLIAAIKTIEEWKTENKVLGQKLEEVKLKNENLKIRINEINEWAEYVVKGIGPCVWVGGIFERPEPNEIVKNGSPRELINKLNEIFKTSKAPEAKLLKIEDGTAYIKISDDEKLTQGMGTSGAANYLNSINYTLWSIKGIKCVDIDFEEGDHAFPTKDCIGTEL
jgi:spore germination protein GerM